MKKLEFKLRDDVRVITFDKDGDERMESEGVEALLLFSILQELRELNKFANKINERQLVL